MIWPLRRTVNTYQQQAMCNRSRLLTVKRPTRLASLLRLTVPETVLETSLSCALRPLFVVMRVPVLRAAMSQLGMSARAFHRILKLARPIDDLEGAPEIKTHYLTEAIGHRPPRQMQMITAVEILLPVPRAWLESTMRQ
jgi:hypothetical protein